MAQMKDTGASSQYAEAISIGFYFFFPCMLLYLLKISGRARLEVLFPKVLHCVTLHSPHEDGNCVFKEKLRLSDCLPCNSVTGSLYRNQTGNVHLE